ncbi:RecQ family ATP-dependent DNA helicase [Candidatus Parcubacteria bacterium]|nr:MAG: RecQ family ATP-dependent DNA helicase [Candidatus Parcubacteria bacterium]
MLDKALIEAIQQVLDARPEGLNEREIRREVLEQTGLRRRPVEIRDVLTKNPEKFVGPLTGSVWRLRAVVEAEAVALGEKDAPREREEIAHPYLANLPSLDAFIAFDLETTGLNPEQGRIIQVSAVRVINGEPASTLAEDGAMLPPLFNEYVNLEGQEIPYSLKVKLGLTAHPEWEEALAKAAPVEEVLHRFQGWVGDLPLVAHNARFDMGFLEQKAREIGWQIENPVVDTLELGCLARPDLNSLRLEELAKALGVGEGEEGGYLVERWAIEQGVEAFSWTGFHNAVVDVMVLAAVVPRLVEALRQRLTKHPELAGEFCRLMPRAATMLGVEASPVAKDRDLAVRALVQLDPVPEDRLSRLVFSFTPEAVRARFEAMIQSKGLKRRESQLKMVEAVSCALQDSRFMAIEAPTGTGKTFAYLIPAVLWARSQGEPVVISTYTRLLQDQMAGDLEKVRQNLAIPFQPQVLKGMANYACLERVAAVYAQTDVDDLDDEERFAWLCVLCWLSATREGLLDEISYWAVNTFPALARLRDSLRAERGECSHDRCEACPVCFHRLAYSRAEQADVVVMNHALLLSREDWGEQGLPFARVVVDEAHNLEDAATDAATDEVSWETISYLANRLLDQRSGQGVLIRVRDKVRDAAGQAMIAVALYKRNVLATLTKDFGGQLKRYVELNRVQVDPQYGAKLTLEADPRRANPTSWQPVQAARERLTRALRETGEAVRRLYDWLAENPLPKFQQETQNELWYLADKLVAEAALLEDLLRVGYDRMVKVHWVEVERARPLEEGEDEKEYTGPYRWSVKRAPVRVGPYLNHQLYASQKTVVLTSATLRTTREAGFGFILDRLGLSGRIQPEDAIALPVELDYSRALFGVARYMRYDARPSEAQNFVNEVSQELGWFFRFTGGNGLGLFTARTRMLEVFKKLEPALGQHSIPVGCQGATGSRRTLLDELKERPGSVLLGLRSFWEGVDVPGPNLCYVVMEKLPFPLLGEPVIRARSAEARARGMHEFMDYILPLMLIDFKQGFGRLIRDEDDIGAVLLLDKRVWNREYRRDLIAALPGMDEMGGDGKHPVLLDEVLDEDAQLSRRAVYRAIADHMRNAPPAWRIDLERMEAILAEVPEELLTKLEQLLAELQLPDVIPLDRLREFWDRVVRAITEIFHFQGWRVPEQEKVVEALLAGRDALVVLPTGSGKSFTFQLPALLRDGTTLVFSPLKALMKDQVDKLLDRGLALADRVDSTQTAEEQERVFQRMREGTVRLVYVAPERVRDPRLMAALKEARNIVQVVVDEAHCVHMWGQSFRPDFLYIARLVDAIAETRGRRPPVAALTATATPGVRQAIIHRLKLGEGYVEIDRNPNRPELRFVVYNRKSPGFQVRSKRDKLRILLRILRHADRNDENAIVYVNTTREAERLARRLEAMGLDARHYHGKMDDQARKDVQDMFLDGQIKIIVATKAFGMGIDKSDIRYVVHYQIPGDLESYFQEAGRAGRDQQISWCVLLYHEDDLWIHENYFIPKSLPELEQMENVLEWIRKRFQEADWGEIYVDPTEMADALEFDEDRELGIHLHLLEEMGFIRRGVDVTLKASVRLLLPLDTVAAQAREFAPRPVGEALAQILTEQGIGQVSRGELRLVEGAESKGVSPAALDDVFYRLALRGSLIYRAFARAFTLAPGPKMLGGAHLDLDIMEVRRIQEEMEANLAAMRRYAEALSVGDCLREDILRYLGAEKPPTRTDQCCSLCDVNLSVPWADEPLWDDLADPGRYHDAKYAILKAIAWNAKLATVRGRAPYGAWTLAQIILGNDYMATKYEKDHERKKARRRLVVASEHFGVLEGLRGSADTVLGFVDELRDEGYVTDMARQWEGGKYTYPVPTEKGWKRLEEGRLFR